MKSFDHLMVKIFSIYHSTISWSKYFPYGININESFDHFMIKTQSINFGEQDWQEHRNLGKKQNTIAKNIVISARMFTDWKSKTRHDVLRASFRSFVYMGDDDDGVWLVCLGAILTKGSLSVSFVNIASNFDN